MAEYFLDGCAPTPLASYLKALGILRLLSSPENNVKGEAADPAARGWWAGERFHLKTRLDRDALLRFFLEEYAPSPIIAPWNGGSGFYFREGKTGEKDPTTGKKIKTGLRDEATKATKRIDEIAASNTMRFASLAESIRVARSVIREFEIDEAPDPKTGEKAALIARYRSVASEDATAWVDAALAITGDDYDEAALLGSGGNDGNSEYSTAFHTALLSIIDHDSGEASEKAGAALEAALFDEVTTVPRAAGISQLAPDRIASANSSTGFKGAERGDPWSLILMFEGAMAFAGAATTRGAASRARGSFPFTVSQLASGSGAVGGEDDESKRPYELWLPLWNRPAAFGELRALLGEGRARIGRMEAKDGLAFARAVAALGVSRGVAEFERIAFEARYGNMFITVPLGRFRVPDRPKSDPIADLDRGGWLSGLRGALGKNAPARARMAVRRLDDSLFGIAREGARPETLQEALMALGGVVSWLARRREGREKMKPPPRLGGEWVHGADDGSAEFRIAAALASLGWLQVPRQSGDEEGEDETAPHSVTEGVADGNRSPGDVLRPAAADASAGPQKAPPPMAAHFAPVDEPTIAHRFRRWADNDSATVVWGAGSLVQNMIAVLERRLIEQAIRGLDDKPLASLTAAGLPAIAAFLEGPPAFDDARCAALLAGLVWARPAQLATRRDEEVSLPFAYASLKPLFTPDRDLRAKPGSDLTARQFLAETGRLPIPGGLVARLRRGAIDEAIRGALDRARASGIGSPFSQAGTAARRVIFGKPVKPDRLAAALLIPIDHFALACLMNRAYPAGQFQEETNNAA
jgi:CRISPR-associated protein Csx17